MWWVEGKLPALAWLKALDVRQGDEVDRGLELWQRV